MTCEPQELIELAKCYKCIPKGLTMAVWIYLLCQWASQSDEQ